MFPIRLWAVPLLCASFLSGCLPGSKPPYAIQLYTLDYASPEPAGTRLDQLIRIDRFSVAQSYNSAAMVYRPETHRVAVYNYHKWRTNPGDMATDYLLRDFRKSGLFRAVFSYRQSEATRFVVDGAIEEFVESRGPDGWQVILGLQVTLLDLSQAEITRKVVFQKRYRTEQPIGRESPEAFAAGMSAAMAWVSTEIISDVYAAAEVAGASGSPGERE
jgi:cholesterol transport system auxiliary component